MSATLAVGSALSTSSQTLPWQRPRSFREEMIPTLLLFACILLIGSISIPYLLSYLQGVSTQANKKTNPLTSTSTTLSMPVSMTPVAALHAIEARTPDYQDALSDSQNSVTAAANWSNDAGCTFTADGYRVFTSTGEHFCHELGKSYTNYTIRINMMITGGASSSSGALLFRDQNSHKLGGAYVFEVIGDGHYKISNVNDFDHPLHFGASSAIKQGLGIFNKLEVIARGSSLSFFVNDTFLIQLTDTHYTQGTISLATFRGSIASTGSVYFSDLSVWVI
jgi:hypothetical protein